MATKAKDLLVNSYLDLLEKEEFDKITVTNLVEECGVSRQTFYYHFEDIEKMIEWTFFNEIKKISEAYTIDDQNAIAKLFAEFLNKYDNLIRKASKSADFILINNLLFESFKNFLTDYISKKRNGKGSENYETDFFVSYCSGAFSGLVTKEITKLVSDYETLMTQFTKGLKQI